MFGLFKSKVDEDSLEEVVDRAERIVNLHEENGDSNKLVEVQKQILWEAIEEAEEEVQKHNGFFGGWFS